MSNPTWQDITPQREPTRTCPACNGEARTVGGCRCERCDGKGWVTLDTPCAGEPCANPEHNHEAAPTAEWDWAELGRKLRACADDLVYDMDCDLPDVIESYAFLLENPEVFDRMDWPADMPQEPNIELIAAYYRALQPEVAR